MIIKKSPDQIAAMRRAGKTLAGVVARVGEAVRPGVTTKHLDQIASELIARGGATSSFFGYRGPHGGQSKFPGSICASVNEVIVHGIPDKSARLEEGDIVSVDFGLILDGWHADTAKTFAVGEVTDKAVRLLEVTEASLYAGIEECRIGRRVGDIGTAVEEVVEKAGFSVVREFVGHGIGRSLHEDPQVPNYAATGRGPRLEEGMVLAIEPMVNVGGWETKVLEDGWTVATADGSLSAHFEHTVAVGPEGPIVLTALER